MTAGNLTSDPVEINETISKFFQLLYTAESAGQSTEQTLFLDNLLIPSTSSEAKRQLEEPLTSKEVLNAVMNMKSGKTAGPDGIPIYI